MGPVEHLGQLERHGLDAVQGKRVDESHGRLKVMGFHGVVLPDQGQHVRRQAVGRIEVLVDDGQPQEVHLD